MKPRAARPVAGVRSLDDAESLDLYLDEISRIPLLAADERLTLSEHTVHRHVANVLRKLGQSSRAAAAASATRAGLI